MFCQPLKADIKCNYTKLLVGNKCVGNCIDSHKLY